MVQAAELLLEERTPGDRGARIPSQETSPATVIHLAPAPAKSVPDGAAAAPQLTLLSNGRFTVMITAARIRL